MSEDIFAYLNHALDIGFNDQPTDFSSTWKNIWASRDSVGTQPPAALVTGYTLDYHYFPGTAPADTWTEELPNRRLHYELNVTWEPWVRDFIKVIEPWQVTHRSRLAAIAVSPLRINELERRIEKTRALYPLAKSFQMPDNIGFATLQIIIDAYRKYSHVNMDTILKYQKEHEGRSLGGGYLWDNTLALDDKGYWDELYQKILYNLERVLDAKYRYTNINFNTGIRARAAEIPRVQGSYSDWMARSRIIAFHPSWSMLTTFMNEDEHTKFYDEVYSACYSLFNASGERHYPYTEGGQVYKSMANWFSEGLSFTGLDGVSWEAFIGTILGPAFYPFLVDVGGLMQLPSGITFTSLLDTIAMLWVTRAVDGYIVQVGDDFNIWGSKFKGNAMVEIAPEDTKYHWALGVTYKVDPMVPRLSGIKVTMDKTGELTSMPLYRQDHTPKGFYRKRAPEVRATVVAAFGGHIGETTLLEALDHIHKGRFVSGTGSIEDLVYNQPVKSPYAWIESMGLKSAVISG